MKSIKVKDIKPKTELDEFVDANGGIISGDRNVTSNSEIETGPVQKPWNDDSDYEKGVSTTTDRASLYRQSIPWFAVYSYRGQSGRGLPVNETKKKITKKELEEEIVKRAKKDRELFEKDFDGKIEKIVDMIDDGEFSQNQLEKIKKTVLNKLKVDVNENKNVRTIKLTLTAGILKRIKTTPVFKTMFHDNQLKNLKVGENILTVNMTSLGKIRNMFGDDVQDITNQINK
jgi:hypothetical protein